MYRRKFRIKKSTMWKVLKLYKKKVARLDYTIKRGIQRLCDVCFPYINIRRRTLISYRGWTYVFTTETCYRVHKKTERSELPSISGADKAKVLLRGRVWRRDRKATLSWNNIQLASITTKKEYDNNVRQASNCDTGNSKVVGKRTYTSWRRNRWFNNVHNTIFKQEIIGS